jgi:Kef-type K+ transport system membrane component KefB
VNPLLLLMGLLLLAYLGSFLVGEHSIRGVGLPSGTEYIVLGFVLGPNAFGLLERSMLETFDPIADVAVGWIALLIGFGFGVEGGKGARLGSIVGGSLIGLFTGGVIFAALWFVTGAVTPLRGMDRVLVVGGISAACSETTRQAVRWVTERHAASGPLATLLGELTQSDDLFPILVVAGLFAFSTPARLPLSGYGSAQFAPWVWAAMTLGLGAVLGAMAALLLGREFRRNESWGLLLGLAVMGIGITARLGLSSIGTMFAMGTTTSFLSRHRAALREMVAPTERTVLHPALLLAGAHVEPRASTALAFILLFTIAARMSAKGLSGVALGAFSPAARAAGPVLGLGLLCSGALSLTIGLSFALRFSGPVGDTVLATAASLTVLGEFVGPWGLRSALRQAGELHATPAPAAHEAVST